MLSVGGIIVGSQIVEIPYPNTEGAIAAELDSAGRLTRWLGENALSYDYWTTVGGGVTAQTPTVPATYTAPVEVAPQEVYQTTDGGGNPQIAAQTAAKGALIHTAPAETVLTTGNKNFSPAVNADGTINFMTNRTGRNRRFKMAANGASQFYEEFQLTAAQFAAGQALLHHILITGQSLSMGYGAGSAISTTDPFANERFSGPGGVNAVTNDASGITLVPLTETVLSGNGETIANGMADSITAAARAVISDNPSGLTSYDCLVSGSGVGGEPYLSICGPTDDPPGGTASYQEFVSQIVTGKALAPSGYFVPCVSVIHGETDDVNRNNVGQIDYLTALLHWQSDLQAAVHANTTQTGTIPFMLAQTSGWPASGFATPWSATRQLAAALQYPSQFVLVCPEYFLPHTSAALTGPIDSYGSGDYHLIADGYRWMGEHFGKVFRRVFLEGKPWLPLVPLEITRTGSVIAIDFHNPSGTALVFDTTHIANPGNYGFEYFDGSSVGTPSATITGVAFDAVIPNRVNVTLSSMPSGANKRIRYAYTGVVGTGHNNVGPGVGPRGCLRDSDPTLSYYTSTVTLNALTTGQPYPLWNFAPTFDFAVN
jgi:hypothetical protein